MTLSSWITYVKERKYNRKLTGAFCLDYATRNCNWFNQWSTAIREMKELEGKLKRMLKWTNKLLSGCFNKWETSAKEAISTRKKLKKAAARWQNKTMFSCFEQHFGTRSKEAPAV